MPVSSQEKIFTVLGDGSSAKKQCDLKCPPATGTTSIVFVHGFQLSPLKKGDNSGQDCNKYWGDAMEFLRERGLEDLRTVKFYDGDTNCTNGNDEGRYSSDLHHPLYKSLCTDYHADAGPEGTNDESIYHLSCLFSQYLHYNFGRPTNRDVVLVGHSMGGLIMRETLYQMQENTGQGPFPPTIGHVTKAITFNTPHSGTIVTTGKLNFFACGNCQQGKDLTAGSALLSELNESGRNPQTSAGFTKWTVIGSECDLVVFPMSSAIDMDASHTIVYPKEGLLTCYGHGGALHDANLKRDANQFYCDTDNPVNSPCGTDYRKTGNTRWSKTGSGRRGLSQLYYSITGGAERVGSSRHLWLLSTAATAWALLRR